MHGFLFLSNIELLISVKSLPGGTLCQVAGGTRPSHRGPPTSKTLSKNPSRQSLVREKAHVTQIQDAFFEKSAATL